MEEEYKLDANMMTVQTIRSYLGTMGIALDQNKHNKAYYVELFDKVVKEKENRGKLIRRLTIEKEIDGEKMKGVDKEKEIDVMKMYSDDNDKKDIRESDEKKKTLNEKVNGSKKEDEGNKEQGMGKGKIFFLFGPIILLIFSLLLKYLSKQKIKPTQP